MIVKVLCGLEKLFQEVERKWLSLESGGRVPLLKTAFSMTIKGITRCIFDDSFEDQVLVDKVSAAYMNAWAEVEVQFDKLKIFALENKSFSF